MAKVRKASKKSSMSKSKPRKAVKKPVRKVRRKASPSKAKAGTSRRALSDVKIAKLQKLYKSRKYSAQHLCDEFGISMATLFNYLKVRV